jgi:hypothetical protein
MRSIIIYPNNIGMIKHLKKIGCFLKNNKIKDTNRVGRYHIKDKG